MNECILPTLSKSSESYIKHIKVSLLIQRERDSLTIHLLETFHTDICDNFLLSHRILRVTLFLSLMISPGMPMFS